MPPASIVKDDQLSPELPVELPGKDGHAQCQVCEETIEKPRYHYGGLSCYSCRAFFRRATFRGMDRICRFGNKCKLNSKKRKGCIRCRYEKCLKIGMRAKYVQMMREKPEGKEKSRPVTSGQGRSVIASVRGHTSLIQHVPRGMEPSASRGIEPSVSRGMEPNASGGMEPCVSRGMKPVVSQGIEPSISRGMEPVVSQGMEPGVSRGMEPVVSRGLDPVVSRGIEPVVSRGLETGVPRGMEHGTSRGMKQSSYLRVSVIKSTGSSQAVKNGQPYKPFHRSQQINGHTSVTNLLCEIKPEISNFNSDYPRITSSPSGILRNPPNVPEEKPDSTRQPAQWKILPGPKLKIRQPDPVSGWLTVRCPDTIKQEPIDTDLSGSDALYNHKKFDKSKRHA